MKRIKMSTAALAMMSLFGTAALAQDYPAPVPLQEGAQAPIEAIRKADGPLRIAYMPPATEFNYYIAIGEGIKSRRPKARASRSSCSRRSRVPTSTARWA